MSAPHASYPEPPSHALVILERWQVAVAGTGPDSAVHRGRQEGHDVPSVLGRRTRVPGSCGRSRGQLPLGDMGDTAYRIP